MEPTTTSPAPPASTPTNGGAPALGPRSYDAIVVGGGHNGLTTTAYLARAGLRVICLERREILGGACVTEELWPGARVSRCSYVVSMLQPKIVADLEQRDITVLLKGPRPDHRRLLRTVGALDHLADEHHIFTDLDDAIDHARLHAAGIDHAHASADAA